jgi:hypothetical protein
VSYPASVDVQTPDKIANWRPLVQWIMAIPHLIITSVLSNVASVVGFVSWLMILFTGKLPVGLANFQCMIFRYSTRAYAYAGFLHEEYPPFDFTSTASDPGGSPVSVNFEPVLDNRNRLTCALRLIWLIPAALFTFVIWIVTAICWFFGFFAVLFTGSWPTGLHNWIMKGLRVSVRLNAYAYLLTDEYPPFSTD